MGGLGSVQIGESKRSKRERNQKRKLFGYFLMGDCYWGMCVCA